jgi:hypothetical protein
VVVDCTDKVATQGWLQEHCKKEKTFYFRVGYDGHHLTVIDGRHKTAPKIKAVWDDGSGREGYTIVPSWIVPPQIAAAMITYMICRGASTEYPMVNANVEQLIGVNAYMEVAHGKEQKPKKSKSAADTR